jgi:cupin 2 domain-containing protein
MRTGPASHGDLLQDIPAHLPDEVMQDVLTFGHMKVERILSRGHCSPPDFWYDQDQHEWVLLVQGQAIVQFEHERVHLRPGQHINIPAHVKHRVEWTPPDEDTVWLALFYGPHEQ